VWEVAFLCHGAIDGGVFHPTRQLARFSPQNMPYILNSIFFKIISLPGEAIHYRPNVCLSFDDASHVKNCHFGHYYYYYYYYYYFFEYALSTH